MPCHASTGILGNAPHGTTHNCHTMPHMFMPHGTQLSHTCHNIHHNCQHPCHYSPYISGTYGHVPVAPLGSIVRTLSGSWPCAMGPTGIALACCSSIVILSVAIAAAVAIAFNAAGASVSPCFNTRECAVRRMSSMSCLRASGVVYVVSVSLCRVC